MQLLIVKSHSTIEASREKVWKVLTTPALIRKWDDLPEGFNEAQLQGGTVMIWHQPDGSITKLTVTDFVKNKFLKINIYGSKWTRPEKTYDVAYIYILTEQDGHTKLEIEVGDFSILPNGQEYYKASDEFAHTSILKIKALAEELAAQ